MIHHGDCLEVLRSMKENSVDSMVTDPPYGWRFMGKAWDVFDIEKHANWAVNKAGPKMMVDGKIRNPRALTAEAAGKYDQSLAGNLAFQAWTTEWAREVYRVLKPGAHILVFCGPRTYHRMASGIEDAGFEVRDCISWLFGSGFPKSLSLKNIGRPEMGTGLKPAHEMVVLGRKPLSEKTVAANVLKWGCGGLNIDKSRITANSEAWGQEKNLCDSCVKVAEKNAKLSIRATKVSIAQENVDTRDSEKIRGIPPADISNAVIGCSEEMSKEPISSNSSMSTFGKNIQAGENEEDLSSTISIMTDPIIGSKTCSMCARPLTSNIIRTTGLGRFPSNLILSHNEDCVEVGVKKVKNLRTPGSVVRKKDWTGYHKKLNYLSAEVSYGDPDGTETVASFECTPNCAVSMLDSQSGMLAKQGGRKLKDCPSEMFAGGSKDSTFYGDSGGASRFFYCAKSSMSERNAGCEGLEEKDYGTYDGGMDQEGSRKLGRKPQENTKPSSNHHPTVKPLKLMSYLIRLVTPPNGICLDPFMGSGSTGVAALSEGFRFIGIEKEQEYIAIAEKRLEHVLT